MPGWLYTDTTINDAKNDCSTLNKVNKVIENARKAYKARRLAPYEPITDIKYFDFLWLYSTAFFGAQNLMVLAMKKPGSKYFGEYIYNILYIREFTETPVFADVKAMQACLFLHVSYLGLRWLSDPV